jgi:biotin transport system substrate-specific component
MASTSFTPTLAQRFWPATGSERRAALRAIVLAVGGSLLLWASAKVQVPFYPVPMTLQTAAVFLIGIAYGWRLAVATVLLYLVEGALGLPVFAGTPAKGVGLPYMLGPTGGYLLGFAVAAGIAGRVAERSRHWLAMAGGLLAANAAIYLLGAGWLATFIGLDQALALGVVPFVLGDAVKLALVSVAAQAGLKHLRG